ncbi:DUF2958 domain-containing protein [Methylobacterium sp. WL116]|uniref:DUF2958 domain-containing protein n=1 Tax=Methylobacterium sp. WL116 TaxID=2603889 RepID=UPI0011CBD103|nr:DUF2958 domain-containing protein [Methylobacterium sp. WL116]TXM95370.1 DUF2958 domain-containing protein [Methylobacterium sp. WL116]
MALACFTKAQRRQLLLNGQRSAAGKDIDPLPVVKLFLPDGAATWLLSELDPTDPTRAFGLCDLGLGSPELGYVDLNELAQLRGYIGLPVSRDVYFQPDRKLSAYAADAIAAGKITV